MKREFIRITILYTLGVAIIFYTMWMLLDTVFPEANLNLLRALSTAYGVALPDNMFAAKHMSLQAIAITTAIVLLSLGLIIINVMFSAIFTTYFIRPRIRVVTSSRGVLSTKWNKDCPYVLVRLCNFHDYEVVDTTITIALTVKEVRLMDDGTEDEFLTYLPVPNEVYTPPHVMNLMCRAPWTIAVRTGISLSNSLVKGYVFDPGKPITKSFSQNAKKVLHIERKLEILLQGVDTNSYSKFAIYKKILVDEQDGDAYTLHLHEGIFKSLPMEIFSPSELEQYV